MIKLDYAAQPYDFEVLPDDIYKVEITEIKYTSTKKGINLTYTIMDGNYKGRKLFDNANIFHEKSEVRAIGHRKIDGIAYALNIQGQIESTLILMKKPFKIKVKHRINQDDEKINTVSRYYKISDTVINKESIDINLRNGGKNEITKKYNEDDFANEDIPF
ncbi:MAG: DUF669 domain-containing protein [Flavobacteriaceae bacterium]|nr:DUF669 domain-containing protein [Flavobacteriaceae bacterium]